MTAPTRHDELRALRRPFAIGIALIVLAVVALGVVIARYGSNADRPAGIAERWLVAVGDTTRDGVEDDARERIEENGITVDSALALFPELISEQARNDRDRAFESVQVGAAVRSGTGMRVPFRVARYEGDEADGYVFLVDGLGGWQVVSIQQPGNGLWLGGDDAIEAGFEPGPDPVVIERPERAPIGWFVGALGLGVLITAGCVAAVRAATPKPR